MKFLILVPVLMFLGCQSSNKIVKPQQIAQNIVIESDVEVKKDTKPKWINNPNIDGELGAVGIVKLMKNKKKQIYIAKKLAIAALQERKRVEVQSSVSIKQTVVNNHNASVTNYKTTQKSSHFKTDKIVKKAEYSDSENYYIWMVVQK